MFGLFTWLVGAGCSQSVAVPDPSMAVTATDPPTGDDDDAAPPENQAPIADAGADFDAALADEVELNGANSYDPDGDALEFDWEILDKPVDSGASLLNDGRSNPSFFADRPGTYLVEVAVNDGLSVSTDQVVVTVLASNDGPVANAGPDQSVGLGDTVLLNGSGSYDPDGDPLDFQWVIAAAPAGSGATLSGATTALPQFVADLSGVYVVELVVSDGLDPSPPDSVSITASASSDGGCFSCAMANRELQRRISAGDVAAASWLWLFPLALVWRRRSR
ncbi:MAG: PKD domain-containing protein [Myxococcota bacterium]